MAVVPCRKQGTQFWSWVATWPSPRPSGRPTLESGPGSGVSERVFSLGSFGVICFCVDIGKIWDSIELQNWCRNMVSWLFDFVSGYNHDIITVSMTSVKAIWVPASKKVTNNRVWPRSDSDVAIILFGLWIWYWNTVWHQISFVMVGTMLSWL